MLDALETLPEIDAKRVATVGHSRNGKTALVAAAFDDRFAMALPCQAGCGGTAPSRVAPELAKPNAKGRPTAETVAVINKAFPHWFAGNFKAFNEEPARLPFDQHELIALCAPRPVMSSCATEDVWANPDGQFQMLKAADPVYRLVAKDGLGQPTMPEVGKPLLSRLGYFIRPGIHSMTKQEWDVWLDYADQFLR
jgi:dienelactone hydrolase